MENLNDPLIRHQFEGLLRALCDNDNDVRNEAEAVFTRAREEPDYCVSMLLWALRSSEDEQVRLMSAILLRGNLAPSDRSLWPRVSEHVRATVKVELLAAVEQEQQGNVRRKVCHVVGVLASVVLRDNVWPELFPFMVRSVRSPDSSLRQASLEIFSQVAEHAGEILQPDAANIYEIFHTCLGDATPDVRVAALRATVALLPSLNKGDISRYQQLIPQLFEVISFCINSGDEKAAEYALEEVVNLVEEKPTFVRPHAATFVRSMMWLAQASHLDEGVRHMAVEVLLRLCENAPGMVRKTKFFAMEFLPILFKFMLEVDEDDSWNASNEDEEEGGDFDVGSEGFYRLIKYLGESAVLPISFNLVQTFINTDDWKHKFAGLYAIAEMGEFLEEDVLGNIVDMTLAHFQHGHRKVRWAAIQVIGQLATDFNPQLQEQHMEKIIRALVTVMGDANARVQAQAAMAVINVVEEPCPKDALILHVNYLLGKLFELLQNAQYRYVREDVITAIAAVADTIEEAFLPYYDSIMPFLMTLLERSTSVGDRMLRSKIIECMSLIGVSVGKEKFAPDAQRISSFLASTQGNVRDRDDPQRSYYLQAWARICKAMGDLFIPYLPVVMPPVLECAEQKPDVVCVHEDEEADLEGMQCVNFAGSIIGVRTSTLEEKATACSMLGCYVETLKSGFLPYIDQAAQVLLPLVKFVYSEDVRVAAIATLPDLFAAAKEAFEKGQYPGDSVRELFGTMLSALLEALRKELFVDVVVGVLHSLRELIEIGGDDCLNTQQLIEGMEAHWSLLEEGQERIKKRDSRKDHEDFDEEEAKAILGQNEEEEEVMCDISRNLCSIMKTHKAQFIPFFEQLLPSLMQMLAPDHAPLDQKVALWIVCDVIEQTGRLALPFYASVLPLALRNVNSEDADVRQAAVYSVGVAAEVGGEHFAPYLQDALQSLSAVIQRPGSRERKNAFATDNAISALGKVAEFQACPKGDIFSFWLDCLPLSRDKLEGRAVNAQLCRLVEERDNNVLGGSELSNLPKIIRIFGSVVHTKFVDEELTARIARLLKGIQEGLPHVVLQGIWDSLTREQRDNLTGLLQ